MNEPIKKLTESYKEYLTELEPNDDIPKIHVDEIAAKVAAFYEKLRGFIDYKEEHLLRKGFIDRVFRRRYFFKELSGNIGEALIKEIIRSGRLPNDFVPETKIQEVDEVVDAFGDMLASIKNSKLRKTDELTEWLTNITINSIEEILFPPLKENILSEAMFWSIKEKVSVNGTNLSENDINLQLFMGVQRALLRVDEDQLNYRLFKFIHPDWKNLARDSKEEFILSLPGTMEKIGNHLKHPLAKYFFKLCNRYNTLFYLFGDLIDKKNPYDEFVSIFTNEEDLESNIKSVYKKRYEKERTRLNRLAFLSVLSIFLSKIVVAFGLEVPIDIWITNEFSLINTIINAVFPPILMLIIVLSIKMPSDENLGIVLSSIKNIVYGDERKGFSINIPKKKGLMTRAIINILYATLFFFTFYTLYRVLHSFTFSASNIAIFAFFTSLVAATGVKVHNRANELNLEEKKPKLTGFIIDVLGLPFITVGKWGLSALNKLNILVILFNLIIELPFQIFVQFIENFRGFIKSKKEEIN